MSPKARRHKPTSNLPQLFTIATLGSHSALQILKGAKDEGFHTLAVVTPLNEQLYSSFAFVDETIVIPRYSDFPKLDAELNRRRVILVPHGSFVAYLSMREHKAMRTPYFGNKAVLDWEADRLQQRKWLTRAGLKMPRQFTKASEIDRPVIVKLYGAHGGKGYLFVKNPDDFTARASHLVEQRYIMQEYVLGVPVYIHYFYSPLTGKLEIMSMDRRYESNVDSLGRIPLADQEGWDIQPSYVVIGNQPISLRESLLAEAFNMGEAVVRTSREICPDRGLFGAFCLETIVTPESEFFLMEISARIVAGTNLFIDGSPYSYLNYDEPMSTGRRIAREIKNALLSNSLELVLDQSSRLSFDDGAAINGQPVAVPGPGVPAN
ncbi:MAG: 5-formaminoimidazole-4-carboxamide-1-(beta)-D-ribofuranosyl 5'-monophosphate synthetase [Candidatus Eremiobacter antarcticus]|nr:formate--phosphoribosylaminoimidazolecarboxamide ligase [Candidatus Eremiobacteraeota bacterium]MBC5809062.1 formate--phosphoribosylaminoimidazolecarboxamide ligase [Candidatus Eremiobacteraeota bacterium]PZR64292.1 MAG: 5-formaminoimidazole-4-carboxamide-1-(beta)-D-ribofuranosyl 5'-monophosphate synthetase [Candidatus Eremiobacter sp. RRmetagenome_bin22]